MNRDLFEKYGCTVSGTCHSVISTPQPCLRVEKSYKINVNAIKRSLHAGRDDKGSGRNNKNNWLESILKKYQIKKIESDPRTKKYPALIVYNDKELRFHPPKAGSK